MHPNPLRFTSRLVLKFMAPPTCVVDHVRHRQVPRAPLPDTSVTHVRVMSSTTSKGVTPSSSLLRAHAPNQFPPLEFVFPHLSPEVLAGCCEPLLGSGSSRRYLCKSFSGCLSH